MAHCYGDSTCVYSMMTFSWVDRAGNQVLGLCGEGRLLIPTGTNALQAIGSHSRVFLSRTRILSCRAMTTSIQGRRNGGGVDSGTVPL